MFKTIKRLYDTGQLGIEGVKKAVEMKPEPWITPEEFEAITGEKYTP